MARSEDAIRRRALKRQRTEDEQRQMDRQDFERANRRRRKHEQQQQQQQQQQQGSLFNQSPQSDPMQEVGAWKCPGCGNENFASRRLCNSKTCDERRPDNIPSPTLPQKSWKRQQQQSSSHPLDEEGVWICPSCQYSNFASRDVCHGLSCQEQRPGGVALSKKSSSSTPRHDPETSKPLVWSKQADPETLSKNQLLRQRYQETGRNGMLEEDIQRAKILLERDQRKRQKKLEAKQILDNSEDTPNEGNESTTENVPAESPKSAVVDAKAQKARNKKLRKLFLSTGGKGMTPEDVERAKILLSRDERKRSKSSTKSGVQVPVSEKSVVPCQ